ncbi:MAG: hypothetical protein J0I00_06425 [Burkholderiales bacterium]|nr:hypothetical protein [Burkholderiales bacterium]MBS0401060.1 hypothetical protein [Pseudomonadota bacterium]MBS1939267.1 hypothetical protein [Bacteroidota bacterium]
MNEPGKIFSQNPEIVVDKSLLRLTWLCLACIGLAAGSAYVHANIHPITQEWFLVFQAASLIAIVGLIHSYWIRYFHASTVLARGFLILLLAAWFFSAVNLATHAFSWHDEIYSWNLWAIEHWERKPYDRYYTQASYPQLFAYWLASIYGAQGGFVSQLAPRLSVSIPLILLMATAISFWPRGLSQRQTVLCGLVIVWMVTRSWGDVRLGYADPLMAAALVLSIACFVVYTHDRGAQWWWMSIIAAMISALTKQPAVLWACGSLPLLALVGWRWKQWPPSVVAITFLEAALIAWATFVLMPEVTNNQGVYAAGLQDRGVWGTFAYSIDRYFIKKPDIPLVLIASWWSVRRVPLWHLAWWITLAPMIGLWFTLGSYEMRQGLHVIWIAGIFLLIGLNYRWKPDLKQLPSKGPTNTKTISCTIALILALGTSIAWRARQTDFDLQDGQKMAFTRQMKMQGATEFFENVVTNGAHVFVTSNYSWGLFYGRTSVFRIEHGSKVWTAESLRDFLLINRIDYAISSGDYAIGPYSSLLMKLVRLCPDSMPEVLRSYEGRFGVFQIDRNSLTSCQVSG